MSSLVHLLYGFYIFSSAVAGDLSLVLNEYFQKPNMNVVEVKDKLTLDENQSKVGDDLPPIVLVHGIFGFGKGVMLNCSVSISKFTFFVCCFCLFFLFFFYNVVFLINQRLGGLSYFAGAEKKDERVLVPDLGSLTSIYDR